MSNVNFEVVRFTLWQGGAEGFRRQANCYGWGITTLFRTGPRFLQLALSQVLENGDSRIWEAFMEQGWGVASHNIRTPFQASLIRTLKENKFWRYCYSSCYISTVHTVRHFTDNLINWPFLGTLKSYLDQFLCESMIQAPNRCLANIWNTVCKIGTLVLQQQKRTSPCVETNAEKVEELWCSMQCQQYCHFSGNIILF